MHDDQIRGLLRTLEDDREPDPAFAEALFPRLALIARGRAPNRSYLVLVAAALLIAMLGAAIAVGSGLVRLPLVVDASRSPGPSSSGVAVTSPSPSYSGVAVTSPSPSASAGPSASPPGPSPAATPPVVPLDGGTLAATADGLRIRSEPLADAAVLATIRAGQRMGYLSGPTSDGEMDWYEVRIGPGDLRGWIAAGPGDEWLRQVTDGVVTFACSNCDGGPSVMSVQAHGDVGIVIGGGELQDWQWSPDGTRLAATVVDEAGTSVVVMAADGSNRREVGPLGYAPNWSPDGSRLAWTNRRLVVTDAQLTPTVLEVTRLPAGSPIWSPDGSRLAFSAMDCPACPTDGPIFGEPPSAVFTVAPDGTDLVRLTDATSDGVTGWAADGSRLSLIRYDLSGEFPTRAFLVEATGGEAQALLDGNGVTSGATWSPDGTRLALSTLDGLLVLDGNGENAQILAPPGDTGITEVLWSPSGTSILFGTSGSSAGVGADLWIVPADGSGAPSRLTAEEINASQADWQPVLVPLP